MLNHEQNKIDIRFASKYHLIPFNQTVYEYRMKGIDDNWYQTTNNNITYTNLPTGSYTLELRSLNNNIHNDNLCRLKIRILPPWYATRWAILSFVFLIALVVVYVLRNMWLRRKEQDIIREERREKEKIKEVNEAKFRFFTSVSHEFRTPLTLIIGQIELILQSYKLPPMVYNKMIKVIHQSRQLNLLVTELIEFRKYEQNLVVLHVAPCKISEYIYNIFDKFKELAQQRNIKFNFQPLPTDEDIYIDSIQMNKVITNLLSNAFKFTPDNGEIDVNIVKTDDNMIQIKVIDNGVGMKEKDLPNIFNRFFRAENVETKGITGSGIGLALVKDIIERHKGSIEVNSKEGYGSIFVIKLLVGKEHYEFDKNTKIETKAIENNVENIIIDNLKHNIDLPEEEVTSGDNDKEKQDNKDTVIIVEDNLELQHILRDLFSPIYNVITADNGKDAFEIIKSTKIELVLSDVMMPEMTGTELCSKIKKDIKLSHIPVVLLTALNMQEQYLEGLLKGADDYISKPFDSKILLARCNNIVRSRKVLYKQLSTQNNSAFSLLATNSLDKSFLDKVTVIIEEKISNAKLNNDDIASEMNMSRSSFYNKFKDLTGETPNEFVNAYRLKKAAEILLSNNAKSIAEISEILGFNTTNYFCRKFKECYNVSPTQYKQQNTGNKEESEVVK